MIVWQPLLVGFVGALALIAAAFLTYLGVRATRATQRDANAIQRDSNHDMHWQRMLETQAKGFTAQIEPLQRALAALRVQVDGLIAERAHDATRFRVAVVHIRTLREWIRAPVADFPPPPIPDLLVDEV
jgi:hypothetical protein